MRRWSIEKGIEKGRKDFLETAKRMLLEGFDIEKIAGLTLLFTLLRFTTYLKVPRLSFTF